LFVEARISRLKRELTARFTQPRFPATKYTTSLSLSPGQHFEDIYELDGFESSLWVRRPFIGSSSTIAIGLLGARYFKIEQQTDDPDFDPSLDGGLELAMQIQRSTADDILAPRSGSQVLLTGAVANKEFVGTASWARGELDLRWYRALGAKRVLAIRQTAGITVPRDTSPTLPVWRRQYGGGAMDMRSYKRRKLGPLDDNGNGLGGELMTISTLEARLYEHSVLGLAVWSEMGQVWRKVADAKLTTLRFGVGSGLRLQTPVGPIRLDWGWKVGAYDYRLKNRAFHFSIGETF
jgi:outer membrane translocation and assembly module TamA